MFIDTLFTFMYSARKMLMNDPDNLIHFLENNASDYIAVALSNNGKGFDRFSIFNITDIYALTFLGTPTNLKEHALILGHRNL